MVVKEGSVVRTERLSLHTVRWCRPEYRPTKNFYGHIEVRTNKKKGEYPNGHFALKIAIYRSFDMPSTARNGGASAG